MSTRSKAKIAQRRHSRKKSWLRRLPFPVPGAEIRSYLGYTLTLAAMVLLLLISVRLGPKLVADLLTGMVGLFGAGVFVPLGAVLLLGLHLIAGERLKLRIQSKAHHYVGSIFLACLFFGLLALLRPPEASLGGVKLEDVTAGGLLGQTLLGQADVAGLLRLTALAIAGFAALAPRRAIRLGGAAARGGNILTHRAVSGIKAWSARRKAHKADHRRGNRGSLAPEGPELTPDGEADEEVIYEVPASALKAKSASPEPPPSISLEETLTTENPPNALPPVELLEKSAVIDLSKVDIRQRVRLIEEKLAEYGVDAKVLEVNQGPAFTQFGIEPGWDVRVREVKERDAEGRVRYDRDGKPTVRLEEISRTRVKVSRITALANDLAMALAAPTIRIEAPVPGKSMIGIEVPNISAAVVSLRSVIESAPFQRIRTRSRLALALGQGVEGDAVAGDLARMPHLLIAGATGSGKSVCINSIITCLLMHATPEEARLLLVDPKRVELIAFDGIPHLLCPVVVEMSKVVGVLRWAAREMDERYKQFAEAGARNIQSYNDKMAKAEKRGLPYLVVIIDELADLMMLAADEVERIVCRLAQLARATGIHLVIATQRPSVDVVTGLIKANIPTRISFAVTSQVDSRTILDMAGAEKLLGRGDMLYMPTDAAKPVRLQGAFVSDDEIESLVAWWKGQRPAHYVDELVNMPEWTGEGAWEGDDPKMEEARRLVEQGTHPSVSLLQRRLRVGYNRAKRIMEKLEDEGLADGNGEEEGFTRFST